jgi:serine/threonine protein kinase
MPPVTELPLGDELPPGTVVERYVVEGRLGQGSMAVVYRVRHAQLGTEHALKVLTAPTRSIRERLLREGRVQAALLHPNVVRVSDVVTVDGSPGLVMDLVRGPTLEELLSERPLTLAECDALATGILEGVGYAHEHGLVHRDLKPANILLMRTPEGFVPKVADFGLAKLLFGEHAPLTHTRSDAVIGTPAYMAPEQIRNPKDVDRRADLFALGAILYHLVTGRRPFGGEDLLDVFTAIGSAAYVAPRNWRRDLPPRMEAAIASALVADRERRIADCGALLAAWRGLGPVHAPVGKPVRWGLIAGLGTLAAAAAAAVGVSELRPSPAPEPAPHTPAETQVQAEPSPTTPAPVLVPVPVPVAEPTQLVTERPRPAPAPAPVRLTVSSRPVAVVQATLDGSAGERRGRVWEFTVPCGTHAVSLTAADGRTVNTRLDATADGPWCWDFDAERTCR